VLALTVLNSILGRCCGDRACDYIRGGVGKF
jgi:hypothetical protein